MENIHSLTVKKLQAKCREMGMSCSGNKKQLIDRIENTNGLNSQKSPKSSSHGMAQRIQILENQLANTRSLLERYNQYGSDPIGVSLPFQTPLTPDVSPKRSLVHEEAVISAPTFESRYVPVSRNQPSVPQTLSATTQVVSIPQTTSVLSSHNALHVHNIPSLTKTVPSFYNTIPYPQQRVSTHSFSQKVFQTPICAQRDPIFVQPPIYTQRDPIYVQHQFTPLTTCNVNPTPSFSAQPVFQQNHQAINQYGQVREIVALLPDFDPSVEGSINSSQFVKRVELLKSAYGWDDCSVIFSVQQKMRGPA